MLTICKRDNITLPNYIIQIDSSVAFSCVPSEIINLTLYLSQGNKVDPWRTLGQINVIESSLLVGLEVIQRLTVPAV